MAYQSTNPENGISSQSYRYLTASELSEKIDRSSDSFQHWKNLTFNQRGAFFKALALLLRNHIITLSQSIHDEMGKLSDECEAEIHKAANACEYYADNTKNLLSTETIQTDFTMSIIEYEPLGVIFGVMPWNFPIWQIIRFIAPAMMAGNVCLLKPAENMPRTSLLLEHLILDAGFPDGAFQNTFISNSQCESVIRHDAIQGVSLTGSVCAGMSVAAIAGAALKKSVMELGGSDAFIVCDDANLEEAVSAAVLSRFSNTGQTCIAAKRFIVSHNIADEFIDKLKQAIAHLAPLAPLAKRDLRQHLHDQVVRSIELGAKVICGCYSDDSFAHYPPSILDYVSKDMPAYSEELFGPVISIIRVSSLAQATYVANDTPFGLGASIWTADSDQARKNALNIASQLQCGSVFINSLVKSDVRLPFGGCKKSGFGREMAQLGIREFTNAKTVVIG